MDTKELQTMLIALGYNLGKYGADGAFGALTRTAVSKFQADYKVPILYPGTVGPKTESALITAYKLKGITESTSALNPTPGNYIPWMDEGKRYIGLKETPGSGNNSTILGWAKRLGGWVADYYTADSIPWCGLWAAQVISTTLPGEPLPNNPLSALAYNKFGIECSPQFGAIMTFTRTGGGHVAFYVSEDDTYYHVLGANQNDAVNVTRIKKDKFSMSRWPSTYPDPKGKRIIKKFDGTVTNSLA